MTYDIIIGSTHTGVLTKIVEELNDYCEAAIELPNTESNRTLVGTDQDTQIKWDTTTLFYGILSGIEYQDNMLKCKVYDKVYEKLKRKLFTATYIDTAVNVIMASVCTTAGLILGSCPTTLVSVKFESATCLDVVKCLAKCCNKDYWSSGNGTTINIGTRGNNRGAVTPIDISRRGVDRAAVRNRVLVRGFDSNGNMIYGEAKSVGWTSATDRPVVLNEKKATTLTSLNNIAAYELVNLEKESRGVVLKFVITTGHLIFCGDTISLNRSDLDLVGTYRIWKTTKTLGEATIEVDVAEEILEKQLKKTDSLEDIGIYLPPSAKAGYGDTFPSSPSNGDLFYRTDERKWYQYNATTSSWTYQATPLGLWPWEAEISPPALIFTGVTTEVDLTASNGKCLKLASGTGSGTSYIVAVEQLALGAGEFYGIFTLKVAANTSSSNLIQVGIWDMDGNPAGTAFVQPNDFATANTWKSFAIRATVSADKRYYIAVLRYLTDITDIFVDWFGIQPTNIPLSVTNVDILSTDPGSSASTTDPSSAGDNVDPGTISSALTDRVVNDVLLTDSYDGDVLGLAYRDIYTIASSYLTQDSDYNFVFWTIKSFVSGTGCTFWAFRCYDSTDGKASNRIVYYVPNAGTVTCNAVLVFFLPWNVKGHTLILQAYHDWSGYNQNLKTAGQTWGGSSQHTHPITGDAHTTPVSGDSHGHSVAGDAHDHSYTDPSHIH